MVPESPSVLRGVRLGKWEETVGNEQWSPQGCWLNSGFAEPLEQPQWGCRGARAVVAMRRRVSPFSPPSSHFRKLGSDRERKLGEPGELRQPLGS